MCALGHIDAPVGFFKQESIESISYMSKNVLLIVILTISLKKMILSV